VKGNRREILTARKRGSLSSREGRGGGGGRGEGGGGEGGGGTAIKASFSRPWREEERSRRWRCEGVREERGGEEEEEVEGRSPSPSSLVTAMVKTGPLPLSATSLASGALSVRPKSIHHNASPIR